MDRGRIREEPAGPIANDARRGPDSDSVWLILPEPEWDAESPLPSGAMVGGWRLGENGRPGPFQPNPHYRPHDGATPTDPLDAVLRLFAAGEDVGHRIVPMVLGAVLQIGCDERGAPRPCRAPDGAPCVAVVTAEVHKRRVNVDRWLSITGDCLPELTPPGADILFNPGGPAQFRLVAKALRHVE
ncbi:type VII secretion system-associated protein [Nocardia sp. CDC160]|uniref:type VII secretion system-associated protein n=1 Tax=Nocardia sp. CDC160 TaxID=3112166 RepID=UPI002DB6BD33|nr:type VII secretion system-associated protein [Nocardia sp. CDC160]MEC3920258.1 type VII secretion system-associated protein [Nocardia sp. CDC160]